MAEKNNNIENMEENPFLVDLFDEDGNKEVFEHLDTVQLDGNEYVICIPYKEEEDGEVDEVVILKVESEENGESALVFEPNDSILSRVYDIFRERNADKFDFED